MDELKTEEKSLESSFLDIPSALYKDLKELKMYLRVETEEEVLNMVLKECPVSTKECKIIFVNFSSISSPAFLASNHFSEFLSYKLMNFINSSFSFVSSDILNILEEIKININVYNVNEKEVLMKTLREYFLKKYKVNDLSYIDDFEGNVISNGFVNSDVVDSLHEWKKEKKIVYIYSKGIQTTIQKLLFCHSTEVVAIENFGITNNLSSLVNGFLDYNSLELSNGKFKNMAEFIKTCKLFNSELKNACLISNDVEDIKMAEKLKFGTSVLDMRGKPDNENSEYLEIRTFKQFCNRDWSNVE